MGGRPAASAPGRRLQRPWPARPLPPACRPCAAGGPPCAALLLLPARRARAGHPGPSNSSGRQHKLCGQQWVHACTFAASPAAVLNNATAAPLLPTQPNHCMHAGKAMQHNAGRSRASAPAAASPRPGGTAPLPPPCGCCLPAAAVLLPPVWHAAAPGQWQQGRRREGGAGSWAAAPALSRKAARPCLPAVWPFAPPHPSPPLTWSLATSRWLLVRASEGFRSLWLCSCVSVLVYRAHSVRAHTSTQRAGRAQQGSRRGVGQGVYVQAPASCWRARALSPRFAHAPQTSACGRT